MVVGTDRLGEHIVDPDGFADGTNSATGDDTRSRRGRLEKNLATTELSIDFMRDGWAVEPDLLEALASDTRGFFDAFGYFVGLAKSDAHGTFLVSGNDESGEAEATSTFHHLGTAVDKDDLFGELVAFRIGGSRFALATTKSAAVSTAATATVLPTATVLGLVVVAKQVAKIRKIAQAKGVRIWRRPSRRPFPSLVVIVTKSRGAKVFASPRVVIIKFPRLVSCKGGRGAR